MDDPDGLLAALLAMPPDVLEEFVESLPADLVAAALADLDRLAPATLAIDSPLALADRLYEGRFTDRPQLRLLSGVFAAAMADVEAGRSRRIIVEMPPRSGKTTITTLVTPTWALARHPDWPVALTSHDGSLATSWGRTIRRWVEGGALPGVSLAPDAGAASAWETAAGGRLLSIGVRESFTGRGAKVLVIDDPHKDFIDAHSATMRENVWNWWTSVAQPRLEPPYLCVVTMTRWHDDDFVGRLLSDEYPGDPADWTVIRLPALAEEGDALGREPGEPLLSPLLPDEDPTAARERWDAVAAAVGSYIWAALYQQRPSPAKGAIFDSGWWRYWTSDPARATPDGRTVYLDPDTLASGLWVDSWDCAFKATADTDWVVGQRWVRSGPDRYLVAQRRAKWTFTQTLDAMRRWAAGGGPYGRHVHRRLVEEKANGAAILDVLRKEVAGLIPVTPTVGKEGRARAITPECESGHVYLPHPADPGNEWVGRDLLPELRDFPHGAADDQVDAFTQALSDLRDVGPVVITVPGQVPSAPRVDQRRVAAARTAGRVRSVR